MDNIIHASFTPKTTDGGKARILLNRRDFVSRLFAEGRSRDDLIMGHADPANYMPSEYCAPETDPA